MEISLFIQGSILVSGGLFAFFWGMNLFLSNSKLIIMSYILWTASIWLFAGAYVFTGIYLKYPEFYLLHFPFVYTIGPMFYLYYKESILEEEFKNILYHFILTLLVCILILPYHLFSLEEKTLFLESMIKKNITTYAILIMSINVGAKISILLYMSKILWENRYLIHLNKNSSNNKSVFLFITGLLYLNLFLGLLGFIFKSFVLIKLSALLLPLNLFIFFVASSKYSEMISGIKLEIKKARYEQSKIKNLNVDFILNKMKLIMENEKAFADEDISLSILAEDLEISPHQLSEILNEKLKKTFHQFINEHRITEAKKIMLEEKKRAVLSIAFAVGFNSKASFNRAFKQVTGITPQQFRKNYS